MLKKQLPELSGVNSGMMTEDFEKIILNNFLLHIFTLSIAV